MTIERAGQFDLEETLPVDALNSALFAAEASRNNNPSINLPFTQEAFLDRVGLGEQRRPGESLPYRLTDGHPLRKGHGLKLLTARTHRLAELACDPAITLTEQQETVAKILSATALRHVETGGELCAFGVKVVELCAVRPDLVPDKLVDATRQQRRGRSREKAKRKEEISEGFAGGFTDGMIEHLNRPARSSNTSTRGNSSGGGGCGWLCD